MRPSLASLLVIATVAACRATPPAATSAPSAAASRPRLVVLLVIDQLPS